MSNSIRIIAELIITAVIIMFLFAACATPTPEFRYIEERPTAEPVPLAADLMADPKKLIIVYEDHMRGNTCYILYNSNILGNPVAISCVEN